MLVTLTRPFTKFTVGKTIWLVGWVGFASWTKKNFVEQKVISTGTGGAHIN